MGSSYTTVAVDEEDGAGGGRSTTDNDEGEEDEADDEEKAEVEVEVEADVVGEIAAVCVRSTSIIVKCDVHWRCCRHFQI